MQSIKNLKYGRALEFLLFRGVPETQSHLYGQEFHCIHEVRERFKTFRTKKANSRSGSRPQIYRKVVLDPKTNKLSVQTVKGEKFEK